MESERRRDVRFLLVHHTVNANDYAREDVPSLIQGIYQFHTGAEKGWPDVAYNFFVDRYGGVWEGRDGSLEEPVKADATGGSQGFAVLASFIGNHQEAPPTDEALQSMVGLLAWLAAEYKIDTSPGQTVDFISRGSNRWPEGTEVTARTISGHRDMSQTACPGDFVYEMLEREIPRRVTAAKRLLSSPSHGSQGSDDPSPTPVETESPPVAETSEPPRERRTPTEVAGEPAGDSGLGDFLRNLGIALGAAITGIIGVTAALARRASQGKHRPPDSGFGN